MKPKQLINNDIQSIQLLRGIAAVLVVLVHSVIGEPFKEGDTLVRCFSSTWFGVEIFFAISGFIIPYSMYANNYRLRNIGTFFAKRLTRIEPPYIVSIALMLLVYYANTITPWYHGPAYHVDWGNVLGHLGYINAFTQKPWLNWAYWTLAIEFQFYIIVTLFFSLITHSDKKILFVSVLALLGLTFAHLPGYNVPYVPFENMKEQNSAAQIFPFLPFFLMGFTLFLLTVKKITTTEFWILLAVVSFVSWYRTGFFLVAVCAVGLACIRYVKRVPKYLLFLGTISYSLYLTHGAILARTRIISLHYLHLGLYTSWFISIVACVVFAWIYYLIIEKPFFRLSKKIKINKPKQEPEPATDQIEIIEQQPETAQA